MATIIFTADNTIPGQSAADLVRRAADSIVTRAFRSVDVRRAFRGLDRHQLQDLGLDRGAC